LVCRARAVGCACDDPTRASSTDLCRGHRGPRRRSPRRAGSESSPAYQRAAGPGAPDAGGRLRGQSGAASGRGRQPTFAEPPSVGPWQFAGYGLCRPRAAPQRLARLAGARHTRLGGGERRCSARPSGVCRRQAGSRCRNRCADRFVARYHSRHRQTNRRRSDSARALLECGWTATGEWSRAAISRPDRFPRHLFGHLCSRVGVGHGDPAASSTRPRTGAHIPRSAAEPPALIAGGPRASGSPEPTSFVGMTKLRVLVTDEVDPRGVELLRAESALDVDEQPTHPWRELVAEIGGYDAFVGRSATQLPAELLRAARRLRVIGRAGVGTDNIDLPAATSLGIAVINAPSGNTIAVAELFFGALLSFVRHLPSAYSSMRAGRWDRSDLLGTELAGRSLGIVGLGRIGGEVATRARAFGMQVSAFDPYVQRERFEMLRVDRAETLDELLPRCAVLTVHTPLTDETRGMIDGAALARLPKGAIVANFARGGIVEESALGDALEAGHLSGALLDVYSKEPLAADHRFRRMENV